MIGDEGLGGQSGPLELRATEMGTWGGRMRLHDVKGTLRMIGGTLPMRKGDIDVTSGPAGENDLAATRTAICRSTSMARRDEPKGTQSPDPPLLYLLHHPQQIQRPQPSPQPARPPHCPRWTDTSQGNTTRASTSARSRRKVSSGKSVGTTCSPS